MPTSQRGRRWARAYDSAARPIAAGRVASRRGHSQRAASRRARQRPLDRPLAAPLRSSSTLNRSPISPGRSSVFNAARSRIAAASVPDRRRLGRERREQELRLRREPRDIEPRRPRRVRASAEIDPRAHVLQARDIEKDRRARDGGNGRSTCPTNAAGGSTLAARARSRRAACSRARVAAATAAIHAGSCSATSLRSRPASGAPSARSSAPTAAARSACSGPSAHANPSPRSTTPRGTHAPPRFANRDTGNASSTSFATIACTLGSAGKRSSHATRPAKRASALTCLSRRSALGSRIR